MSLVLNALAPIFMLIVLGYGLSRTLLPNPDHWLGIEQLTYYVLFPALLIYTLARADLSSVPVFGVGGALLLAVLVMSALCLALRPLLASRLNIQGPAFTSVFQGAARWQTYIALAVAGNLFGYRGLALASVAMIAMIPMLNVTCVAVLAHYASPRRLPPMALIKAIAGNPLTWACVVGLAVNLAHLPIPTALNDFVDALGRASLATGLLTVGAGLDPKALLRPTGAAIVAVTLKLVVMPAIAIALALLFGVGGAGLVVVACCSAVPTASSAYLLAKQMGGDAPLMAEIITLQTAVAALTMPIALALVQ